mmetsp:Transcript_45883/g.132368  ORF Transcript_45883/g.132368 Transcript_45883/m.132368 type:complete len:90 (-) Transcript_45883:222-491(-)
MSVGRPQAAKHCAEPLGGVHGGPSQQHRDAVRALVTRCEQNRAHSPHASQRACALAAVAGASVRRGDVAEERSFDAAAQGSVGSVVRRR